MRRFHGDLLIGGQAIREVDGLLDDVYSTTGEHHDGSFEVGSQTQPLLEIGRPYLLMLDDGQSVKLVVKEIEESDDPSRRIVQFDSV